MTELNVLYPFAGEHLKCRVKSCRGTLLSLMEGIVLNCVEWDTLRGKSYDLSVVQNQDDLDRQVAAGEFSIILMSPPCNSYTRVLFANNWGPKPIRTADWPWGFPWLSKKDAARAEAGNCLVKFCLRLLDTAGKASSAATGGKVRCFWEHPEDLGALWYQGEALRPASVWQLDELHVQASPETGRTSRTIRQCRFEAPRSC